MNTPTAQANSIHVQAPPIGVQAPPDEVQPAPDDLEALYDDPEGFEDELGLPADAQERAGRVIRKALRACANLDEKSPQRAALWLTVQSEVCTTTPRMVRPFGSTQPFLVTQDRAGDELITAMTWLITNEAKARTLSPLDLFVILRGVATKSGTGSARAVQADSLHGVTEVPSGCTVTWGRIEEGDAA
jgi:hypothetical protein